MEKGWIKIHRRMMDDEVYFLDRFDRTHAWLDLLLMAEPKPRTILKRGVKVKVGVGEVAVSMRQLSERWGWYLTGVLNFIKELEQERKIKVNKTNVISVLQILNWEKYQVNGTQIGTQNCENIGTQIGTQNPHADNVLQEVDPNALGTQIGTQSAPQPKEKNQKKIYKEDKNNIIKSSDEDFCKIKILPTEDAHAREVAEVVEKYHEICKSFPRLARVTDARKAKIKIRFLDEMKGDWNLLESIYTKMEQSKFLRGDNKRGWRASFDWLFTNGTNWVKVAEGNYDDRQAAKELNQLNPNDEWQR